MTLEQLEDKIGKKYPKKWHELNQTGIMEWLTCSQDEFNNRKEEFFNNPKTFFFLNADCEPLMYDRVKEKIDELNEWISWAEEDEDKTFDSRYTLIPFAQYGNGDVYCFLYEEDTDDVKIISYFHDDYEEQEILANNFDEFLYIVMLDACSNDENINGETWKAHLEYLSDEYKTKLENKTADILVSEYEEICDNLETINLFIDNE